MDLSDYLCPSIRDYVAREPGRKSKYEFKDPAIQVSLWSPLKGPVYDHEYLARLTHILTRWIRGMRWSRVNPTDLWTIEICLTPMKKRWCSSTTDSKEIGICDANSGETEQSRGRVQIRVIRAECCVRTIIHELLHAHKWDRVVPQSPDEYEGLVEACTRMLYCQWFGRDRWRSMLLDHELPHSKRQVDFLRHTRWSTTTHIRAYYYLTTALLNSFDDFRQWLDSSRHSSELRESWPALKNRAWKAMYGLPASASIQDMQLSPVQTDSCVSLAMVEYQAPLTVQDAKLEFLRPPSLTARSGGGGNGSKLFFMPGPDKRCESIPTLTLLVSPSTSIRHPNAPAHSKWLVTDGQGYITPIGLRMRGQTFEIGSQPIDLVLRNDNRWYPFIVVQLE